MDSAPPVGLAPKSLPRATAEKINPSSYAVVTITYLFTTLLLTAAVFAAIDGVAHESFSSALVGVIVVCILFAFITGWLAVRAWNRIPASQSSAGAWKVRRKRFLTKAAVLAVLFLGGAAIIGFGIGQDGKESAQVVSDLAALDSLGRKITQTRTPHGVPNISWYLAMYASITEPVSQLDAVLHRLAIEYPPYAARFPDQRADMSQTITDVNIGIRRMALLKQQIEIAKRMEGVDEDAKVEIWRNEMIPVLKQEDALDNSR